MTDDINFVLRARREKLEAIRAAGVEPFAYSFDRKQTALEALASMPDGEHDGPEVSAAGRIVAWRAHGKTAFAQQRRAL